MSCGVLRGLLILCLLSVSVEIMLFVGLFEDAGASGIVGENSVCCIKSGK